MLQQVELEVNACIYFQDFNYICIEACTLSIVYSTFYSYLYISTSSSNDLWFDVMISCKQKSTVYVYYVSIQYILYMYVCSKTFNVCM